MRPRTHRRRWVPWAVILTLGPLLGIKAQDGPLYWAVARSPESAPWQAGKELADIPAPEDLLLWEEGVGFAVLSSGRPFPRSLTRGVPLEVDVVGPEGAVGAGVDLEYRPVDWPNLPVPFGRAQTDGHGRARLFLPKGRPVLLWIANPSYLPKPILVEETSSHAELRAEPSPPGSLRVEGPFGRALGGASVLFMAASAPLSPLRLARERDSAASRATADAQGFLGLGYDTMERATLVWAKGYSLKEVPPRTGRVRVALVPAAPVRLRVKKPQGKDAVWRAEVRYAHDRLPWLTAAERWEFSVGRGTVFPPGFPCRVMVSADGCATEALLLNEPPALDVTVALSPSVTLAGRVVDEQGQPVKEAKVFLGALGSRPFVRTDTEGRFVLPPQPANDGPWDLFARADDYLTGEIRGVPAAKAGRCVIVLSGGGGLEGRVEAPKGEELPTRLRVRVEALLRISSQGAAFDARVGEDGSFSVRGLDEGSYRVRAFAPGLRSAAVAVFVQAGLVSDAGILRLGFHPKVTGRLTDPEGEEVDASRAEVRLTRTMGPSEVASEVERFLEASRKSKDGGFEFWGVPAGTYRIEAHHAGFAGRSKEILVAEDDVDAGELTVSKEVTLQGHLVSRKGRDWAGYRILLQTGVLDYDGPRGTADSSGRFTLGPVAPGRYTLSVFEPFAIVPRLRRPLDVDAAKEGRELPVFLDGVELAVFARVDGRPAARADLTFQAAHDEPEGAPLAINTPDGMLVLGFPAPFVSAPTDGGGLAVLAECPVGPGTAVLSWNGGEWSASVTVLEEPRDPVVWEFRGSRLEGRAVDAEGSLLSGVRVHWEYAGKGPLPGSGARTGEDGRFVLEGLGAGSVRIWASEPERGSGEVLLSLPRTEAGPVVLRLTR